MTHADDLLRAAEIVSASAAGLPKSLGGDNEALASRLRAAAETHVLVPKNITRVIAVALENTEGGDLHKDGLEGYWTPVWDAALSAAQGENRE